MSRVLPRGLVLLIAVVALLCGCAAPRARGIYVLGAPAPIATARPAGPDDGTETPIELLPVVLPAYLDSTDILTRRGAGQLVPSETGRWGERLALGIGDALVAELGSRPRPVTLVAAGSRGLRGWQLRVAVTDFDTRADGSATLVASWSIRDGSRGPTLLSDHGSFTVAAGAAAGRRDDAAVVAAMSAAVAMLGDRIAGSVRTVTLVGETLPL